MSSPLQIGTSALVSLATTVALYAAGDVVSTTKVQAPVLSGATLYVNVPAAGINQPSCRKSDGSFGYLVRTATGFIQSPCN